MNDEVRGEGFVMRSSPTPKNMSGKEYARAWLKGEIEASLGKGYTRPSLDDVMSVLRGDPRMAQQYVSSNVNVSSSHDGLYVEKVHQGYDVYMTEYGRKTDLKHFDDLWSALAQYWRYSGLK